MSTREPVVSAWPAGHSRWLRGQNFCLAYTAVAAGQAVIETGVPDEHLVLSHAGAALTVSTDLGDVVLDEPGLFILPAGTSSLVSDRNCVVLRIFTSRHAAAGPIEPDPMVTPLPAVEQATPRPPRVHRLADVPPDPDRLGRIFITGSLMVNWFPPRDGPRDPETLSPHVHDDFEQASVALRGDFVHHFRIPWTVRLSEWRPDRAVACASPSVALIPPGVIHTTRAVGAGGHDLIDVFAPPRADFAARGWILNADEYE